MDSCITFHVFSSLFTTHINFRRYLGWFENSRVLGHLIWNFTIQAEVMKKQVSTDAVMSSKTGHLNHSHVTIFFTMNWMFVVPDHLVLALFCEWFNVCPFPRLIRFMSALIICFRHVSPQLEEIMNYYSPTNFKISKRVTLCWKYLNPAFMWLLDVVSFAQWVICFIWVLEIGIIEWISE